MNTKNVQTETPPAGNVDIFLCPETAGQGRVLVRGFTVFPVGSCLTLKRLLAFVFCFFGLCCASPNAPPQKTQL